MRTDHFRNKRIEPLNERASRFVIVPQGSLNQLSSVVISHVAVEVVSTLLTMTAGAKTRLQISFGERDKIFCNRTRSRAVTLYEQGNFQ
jgi:hypothetical protein